MNNEETDEEQIVDNALEVLAPLCGKLRGRAAHALYDAEVALLDLLDELNGNSQ